MNGTWTCNRCLVMHRIDPEKFGEAYKAGKVFRCEVPKCTIVYDDRQQDVRRHTPPHVRLYLQSTPS